MATINDPLEKARDEPAAAPKLTPPPRARPRPDVARPDAARPDAARPDAARPASEGRRHVAIWLTAALFAALGVAAVGVFVVLPDWVSAKQRADEPAGSTHGTQVESVEPVDPAGLEEPAAGPEVPELEPPEEPATARAVVDKPAAAPAAGQKTSRAPTPAPRPLERSRPSVEPSPQRPDGEFERAMSEGLEALDRGDHAAAREAFSRAASLRPGSPQSADGLARADAGLRLAAITELREEAAALEAREDWAAAAERYAAVLRLDPTVEFAQRGEARSRDRAELSRSLDFHLANPHRLSSDEVLAEASAALDKASRIDPAGPRLERQVRELARQVEAYSTPVRAVLESDELTEVTVYRVGRLGTFRRHALELRPGTYTVVGSRRGYRDVRRQLVIAPGAEPVTLVIRCEEEV